MSTPDAEFSSPKKVIKPLVGNTPDEKKERVQFIKAKKDDICNVINDIQLSDIERRDRISEILTDVEELQKVFLENGWCDDLFVLSIPDWQTVRSQLLLYEPRLRDFQKCSHCLEIRQDGHLCEGIIRAREEKARQDKAREIKEFKAKVKNACDVLDGLVIGGEVQDNNNPLINDDDARPDAISIFEVPNKLSFVAWNAHTLSAMDDKKVSVDRWDQICLEFSKHDVITMTEMLPLIYKKGKERFEKLFSKIKGYSPDAEWNYRESTPSGPGNTIEVHIMLVKGPITIVDFKTFALGDYWPLIAHLRDERMVCSKFAGDFVVTSVHMPPCNPKERRIARDQQIYNLIRKYIFSSEYLCDRNFADIEATNAQQSPTIHIIQGDWNKWIGYNKNETISMSKAGFEVVLSENVYTTSGGKCYDNFIISNNYSKYLNIPTRKVLRFKNFFNSRVGASGLSDHAPIMFELEVLK